MASQDAVVLENSLKLFVETKVGERVSLVLSANHIKVKPDNKSGSTTLGSFWVRVIQSYFPSPQFTYQKFYDKSCGSEAITVSLEYFLFS